MIIVDTTVWIDYLTGKDTPQTLWLETAIGRHEIGLTDVILCEVLQGVRSNQEFNKTRRELLTFDVFVNGGVDIATSAAQNYRLLRSLGITVRKTIDCLIATFCIENDFELLHNDRDFDPFEEHLGLRVIHP